MVRRTRPGISRFHNVQLHIGVRFAPRNDSINQIGIFMMMLPPVVVSLPFKLIFFVLVDGWSLVAGSLVQSYGGGG